MRSHIDVIKRALKGDTNLEICKKQLESPIAAKSQEFVAEWMAEHDRIVAILMALETD